MTQSEHYAADAQTGFTWSRRRDRRLAGHHGQFDPFWTNFPIYLFCVKRGERPG
jgi:hypothetical protein